MTIVEIIKTCVSRGLSVLCASFTNSAVDNVLSKLSKSNNTNSSTNKTKILRLGRVTAMHPEIRHLSEHELTRKYNNPEDLENFYKSCDVVGATCLGADHPLFKWKQFDLCIIDEASQILEPLCFAPIFKTRRFLLVGDYKQLPPLVTSEKSKTDFKSDISLFERLAKRYPHAVSTLKLQYRMDRQIMELANHLIYTLILKYDKGEILK